jgi:hypothetical protein
MEMVESQYPDLYKEFNDTKESIPEGARSLYHCLSNDDNKPYLVANSVIENLDMLKINKKDAHFNWQVFKYLKNQKVTFIFNDNSCLRMVVSDDTIWFCHIKFTFEKGSDNNGQMYWVMFHFNRESGELCDHFNHPDVLGMEEHVYKFLCFFYLTNNSEEFIPAGQVYGTRKTGKIKNDFSFLLTLVNSRWNTTTIRTEQFGVRGHFRLQPRGVSRQDYEMIFIEPYTKNGYIRRAGVDIHRPKFIGTF